MGKATFQLFLSKLEICSLFTRTSSSETRLSAKLEIYFIFNRKDLIEQIFQAIIFIRASTIVYEMLDRIQHFLIRFLLNRKTFQCTINIFRWSDSVSIWNQQTRSSNHQLCRWWLPIEEKSFWESKTAVTHIINEKCCEYIDLCYLSIVRAAVFDRLISSFW